MVDRTNQISPKVPLLTSVLCVHFARPTPLKR
jgi:hypothetical protein